MRTRINQSQKEIILSEETAAKSAINVISVKLYIEDFSADEVKEAADQILESADVFTSSIEKQEDGYYMIKNGKKLKKSTVTEPMNLDDSEAYFMGKDSFPLSFPEKLYEAEIIPVIDGGSYLYVRFHHVIIDGYGMCLFCQAVLDILENRETVITEFITDQKEIDNNSADREFWRNYFSEAEFEPSFFSEKVTGMDKSIYKAGLPQTLEEQLVRFSVEQQVTVPYILCAAYALYLAQATDKQEAMILMPRLNRTPEQLHTIGCYTMMIPLRITIRPEETFAELCRRVQKCAREAAAHKGLGYDQILAIARAENAVSGTLAEYVFNYYRFCLNTKLNCSLDISVAGGMRNHLTWNVFQTDGSIQFSYDLKEGIYTEERAQFFTESIHTILLQGFQQKKAAEISIVGDAEKKKLLSVKGETCQISKEETIPSLLRRAAERYPEAPALYAGEEAFNFRQLDEVSDRIAYGLIKKGIKNGDTVAYMLPRDIRLIPTMFGISKTGAAFIPIDPAYPKDRIDYIMENSEAAHLISTASVAGNIDSDYLEIDELIAVEIDASKKDECGRLILPDISQEQLAYMIYTSGTTGRPKGVMLSHRGIANIVHPQNNPFNKDISVNGTGIVAIGSVCFDISLFEMLVPLFNGKFVEFGNEKSMLDAGELARMIQKHGANILHCTPSRLSAYLGNAEFVKALKGVEAILAAGEMLPQALVDKLRDSFGIRIYNGYGPTETTIGATITEAGDNKTIGLPIMNMGTLLLNQYGNMVPFGASGEIVVYGNGVGLGYKNREEETKKRFINWEGVSAYRTGDIGQYMDDGRILYHGRNDRQIKLRGLRIELSEIEKAMTSYPGVKQANCIVKKIDKTEHLVGFYTLDSFGTIEKETLKQHIKGRLTAYMVPDILKELERMPQTPGGKTDLKALEKEPIEVVHNYREPVTHAEKMICQAFEEILMLDKVGADDNFFEIGGDSLMSVELMLIIEKKLELEDGKLEYTHIYQFPTPALLAEFLAGDNEEELVRYPVDDLNYEGIPELLQQTGRGASKETKLGNVLLTGATGYLGIHILVELLRNKQVCDKIYCLVRSNKRLSYEKRLRSTLFYYAEEDFTKEFGTRLFAVEGDVTDLSSFEDGIDDSIDTIVNSAANVAHFAYGDALTKVNIAGLKNLIQYAEKKNAALCQISTISVGGEYKNGHDYRAFTEQDLYIGQEINNEYIYSKYMAEYALLRAAVDDGLNVKIMRVGNLQGRSSDGEFQMNMKSNAFTRQMSSYIRMKAVPRSVYEMSVNFSPIDETAHMIVYLTGVDTKQTVFHVYPSEEVAYSKICAVLEKLDKKIQVIPDEDFEKLLSEMKRTEEGKEIVEGLLTERPNKDYYYVPVIQDITNGILYEGGQKWLPMTEKYLKKYLTALNEMDMF